ncbi:hypothetical protein AALT_g2729 [Alternaria alternata]|nr:hypothetical protein AALT_g2729 [Alternaria alternata]
MSAAQARVGGGSPRAIRNVGEAVPVAATSVDVRKNCLRKIFEDKDWIFSVYAAFEPFSHFAACLEKGKTRAVIVTRLIVLFIATLDNPVVRVSMVIPVETKRIFSAIGALDKTAGFPK